MLDMSSETERLVRGPDPGEEPGRAHFVISVGVRGDSVAEVIERASDLLRQVVGLPTPAFEDGDAAATLPDWFVRACAPQRTAQERAAWLQWWRSLDSDARVRAESERAWTVENWLFWMRPGERAWFWWEARLDATDAGSVSVAVAGWPTAIGSLLWLLRAAGADDLIVEDDF